MKSIRHYLLRRIVLGSIGILVTGSIGLGWVMHRMDSGEFDALLEAKARVLATLMIEEGQGLSVNFADEFIPQFEGEVDTEFYQFRHKDGTTVERSNHLGNQDLPFILPAGETVFFRNIQLPDGRRGRFVQIHFPLRDDKDSSKNRSGGPDGLVLGVAVSREELDDLLLRVNIALAVTSLSLIGLIALHVHRSLNRGLRPLLDLKKQVAALSPQSLDKRILLPGAPEEIEVLPHAMNAFIESLQSSFDRERRFSSDVAHEMRTPLAEFRLACEVAAKWSDDPDLVRRCFENLQISCLHMESKLNNLLELSRLEAAPFVLGAEDIPVAEQVETCWARILRKNPDNSIRMLNRIPVSMRIYTDASKFEMILLNVLENAASYSLPESEVTCEGEFLPQGGWKVRIRNQTQLLEARDMERLFDRFWRKESARTTGEHAGLGLAIVKSLAQILNMEVTAAMEAEDTFCLTILFGA